LNSQTKEGLQIDSDDIDSWCGLLQPKLTLSVGGGHIARDMPVVGRWKSKDGAIFYLAIGVLLDAKGQRVQR